MSPGATFNDLLAADEITLTATAFGGGEVELELDAGISPTDLGNNVFRFYLEEGEQFAIGEVTLEIDAMAIRDTSMAQNRAITQRFTVQGTVGSVTGPADGENGNRIMSLDKPVFWDYQGVKQRPGYMKGWEITDGGRTITADAAAASAPFSSTPMNVSCTTSSIRRDGSLLMPVRSARDVNAVGMPRPLSVAPS